MQLPFCRLFSTLCLLTLLPQAYAASQEPAAAAAMPPAVTEVASTLDEQDRRFGLELNPYMLFQSFSRRERGERESSEYETYLTGTLSMAVIDTRTELALPFAVIDYNATDDDPYESDYSLRRIDMQLRRYQKAGRIGLYAGALVRYSRIEGEPFVGGPFSIRETDQDGRRVPLDPVAFSRVGAGVVFGLRGFIQIRRIKGRVFWGANVHYGRWLSGSPTPLRYELGPLEDAKKIFANIEFAKIGVRF